MEKKHILAEIHLLGKIDMWKEIVKFDERDVESRVQRTGYCRRCQQMVTKYQKCPLRLPAPPVSPSCPMREEEGRRMLVKWLDILKVDDIDFDKDLQAFGAYSFENRHDTPQSLMNLLVNSVMRGKAPELKDLVDEKIRINHQGIYRFLKHKLEREPTEKEIMEFVIRTIMHEGTHAGMGTEQFPMSNSASEYGAIVGQFPENTYYRLKTYLKHPDSQTRILPRILDDFGVKTTVSKKPVEEVRILVGFIDGVTDGIKNKAHQEKAREKLARMEMTARTHKKNQKLTDIDPSNLDDLVGRYGEKHRKFLSKLLNEAEFDDSELKMAATVSTSSAPAMFNKVVRGRKKRRDKDARR